MIIGVPVAFALGGVAVLFALLGEWLNTQGYWIDAELRTLALSINRLYGIVSNINLVPVPLFIFMGIMMQQSRIAEDLLNSLGALLARLPGGMGLSVVAIGVVLAASTGIVGASVVMLATLALPTLLAARYDARLSSGLVAASGTLGILIQPSIMLLIMAEQMLIPVPDLFAAALLPGLLLAALYGVLIVGIAVLRPDRVPPFHSDAPPLPLGPALRALLVALVAPVALIFAVLGSIVFGLASPGEAAGVGAFGALLLAGLRGSLSLKVLRDSVLGTARTTSFILLLMFGATTFAVVLRGLGGDTLMRGLLLGISDNTDVIVLAILAAIFLLGFFLDWIEISLIVLPIVLPVLMSLGVDPVWFAILVAVCLQTSFLTPPIGGALFFLRAAAPPEITLATIYRGIVPFVLVQLLALAAVFLWPALALHLPTLFGR